MFLMPHTAISRSSNAWDSFMCRMRHQSTLSLTGSHEAPDGPVGGVSSFSFVSKPSRLQTQEWVKRRLVISVSTHGHLLSWVTVWRGGPSVLCYHLTGFPFSFLFFPLLILGNEVSCIFNHRRVKLTMMTASHHSEVLQNVCGLCYRQSTPRNRHSEVKKKKTISHRLSAQIYTIHPQRALIPADK